MCNEHEEFQPCIHQVIKSLVVDGELREIGETTVKMLMPHYKEIESAMKQMAAQVGKDHYLSLSLAFVWHQLAEASANNVLEKNPEFNRRRYN